MEILQQHKKLIFGAILPHVKLFGGVRRFLELGKILHDRGHSFIIFTPEGIFPGWFSYNGKVEKLTSLSQHKLDCLFFTEPEFLKYVLEASARLKILYHVGPRARLNKVLKHKEITIFANSSNMYDLDRKKYGIKAVKAFGGVHIPDVKKAYSPASPLNIMVYGRLTRKGKGTALVVKACEKLYRKGYDIKLLLFDSPIDKASSDKIVGFTCKVPFEFIVNHPVDKNNELFRRADIFVAAEKKGGWSNTAAEALAAGVPLIGTKIGTRDFLTDMETGLKVWRHPYFIRRAIEKLIRDPALAQTLAANGRKKIENFSWKNLADFIESYVLSANP